MTAYHTMPYAMYIHYCQTTSTPNIQLCGIHGLLVTFSLKLQAHQISEQKSHTSSVLITSLNSLLILETAIFDIVCTIFMYQIPARRQWQPYQTVFFSLLS